MGGDTSKPTWSVTPPYRREVGDGWPWWVLAPVRDQGCHLVVAAVVVEDLGVEMWWDKVELDPPNHLIVPPSLTSRLFPAVAAAFRLQVVFWVVPTDFP